MQLAHDLEDGLETTDLLAFNLLVVRRPVGAAEDRFAVRGEEHRHWPAATRAQDVQSGHVDRIDVWPFLAVHLDADKVLVEHFGYVVVGEGLALHDMAPVARAIADREKDELAFLPGFREGLTTPGMPVHGIVGMHEEIGARFAGEPVRWT